VRRNGEALLMATPTDSPTGRNLAATPRRIQAWREVNELPDRELMETR
jgi:hypothetical protein